MLLEEIVREISLGEEEAEFAVGKGGGYFFGVKSIFSFSDTEVVLDGWKGRLTVQGKGLAVDKYFGQDVLLSGEILSVSREERRK